MRRCAIKQGTGGFFAGLFLLTANGVSGQTNQIIYTDALQNGWQNYGWTKINYASTAFVHSGANSISVTKHDDNGRVVYEIEFKDQAKNPTMQIAEDGTLVQDLQK